MRCWTLNCTYEATGRVRVTLLLLADPKFSYVSEPQCDNHQVEQCLFVRKHFGGVITVCAVPLNYEERIASARRAEREIDKPLRPLGSVIFISEYAEVEEP